MTTAKEFVNVFPEIVHIVRPYREIINLSNHVSEIIAWCKDRNFDVQFTNSWSENNQMHICFKVDDETQRFWFALKWN